MKRVNWLDVMRIVLFLVIMAMPGVIKVGVDIIQEQNETIQVLTETVREKNKKIDVMEKKIERLEKRIDGLIGIHVPPFKDL